MPENCKQEKVSIKAHFPRRPQENYMVESNERVEKGGTHPIQGSEGDCNAITGFSEETAITQACYRICWCYVAKGKKCSNVCRSTPCRPFSFSWSNKKNGLF